MIPISLSIKGIYSYQKKQTINFSHLASAGIFGIFGKVGSGKSSILEAMMFAIFGEIERLNKRDNRAYNLMNLKSKDFFIDLIIKNNAGDEYRFSVNGKRNSKKFEEVSIKRAVYKKEKSEWIPVNESAEQIIGLNYDNFRRTIIIPQGKFQDFLQLTDGERTKMMKELFRLHRYDLSSKVSKIEKENEKKLAGVQGQLLQLEDVSEEKINILKLEISKISNELKLAQAEQKKLQKQNEEYSKISELFIQKENLQNKFNAFEHKKLEYEQLEIELNDYNYCVHHFKLPLENKKQTKERINSLNYELNIQKENLSAIATQINLYEAKINELKPEYLDRENIKKQASDLEKLLEIKVLQSNIHVLNGRINDGTGIIKQNIQQNNILEKQQKELKEKISLIKNQMPDLTVLSRIKNWFTETNHLKSQIVELENDFKNSQGKEEKLKNELRELLNDYLKPDFVVEKSVVIKLLHDQFENIEQKISRHESKLRDLNVKQGLIDYSKNLQEGIPCPVCGSKHHPHKIEEDNLNKEIEQQEGELFSLKKTSKQVLDVLNTANNLFIQLENISENNHTTRRKLKQLNIELSKLQEQYPAKEKMNEKELFKAFADAEILQKELQNSENELLNIENKHKKAVINIEKYENGLNLLKNDLIKQESQLETIQSQIIDIEYQEWINKKEDTIQKQIRLLNEKYLKISTEYEQSVQKLNSLSREIAKYEGTIQTIEKDLSINKKQLLSLEKNIDLLLEKSSYKSVEEIITILNKNLNVEGINTEINEFKQSFFNISEQLKRIKQETENKKYDIKTHQKISEDLKNIQQKAELLGKKAGALESEKNHLEQKLIAKQNLQKDLKTLQLRSDNIRTLKSLFAGNGFVNYVSSVYLQNLVNAANSRFFRLSGQKQKLELNENNNFEIRDFLNGGKLRSVKTLSGGQTFQASLSLALALADNVQSMSGSKSNFFFLDEGFGMLDNDALRTVFETLKTLRKENRIVGIISHVEDLQQEIETYLKIENDTQQGSLIHRSWEN